MTHLLHRTAEQERLVAIVRNEDLPLVQRYEALAAYDELIGLGAESKAEYAGYLKLAERHSHADPVESAMREMVDKFDNT